MTTSLAIAITGTNGLLGRALTESLQSQGHTVKRLRRGRDWSLDQPVSADAFAGQQAVVHLAGEPVMGRWTAAKKRAIFDSRVKGTGFIAQACADQGVPTLINASAVGYYGDRGGERLTETAPSGQGFLAEACQAWEQATQPAEAAGVRVVKLRTGVVLSPQGGALKLMLPVFRLGLGGRLGNGRHYLPWIGMSDWVRATQRLIFDQSLQGPFNLTGPEPVTNAVFTRALGKALSRPTLFPVPAFGPRLLFGALTDEALLSSTRAMPEALLAMGFGFEHQTIDEALLALLK